MSDLHHSKLLLEAVCELNEVNAVLETAFTELEKRAAVLFARREELLDRIEALEKLKGDNERKN